MVGAYDPYVKLVGDKVKVVTAEGTQVIGVLRQVTGRYIILGMKQKPKVVIERNKVFFIKRLKRGSASPKEQPKKSPSI
jgi:hypothetical protein